MTWNSDEAFIACPKCTVGFFVKLADLLKGTHPPVCRRCATPPPLPEPDAIAMLESGRW